MESSAWKAVRAIAAYFCATADTARAALRIAVAKAPALRAGSRVLCLYILKSVFMNLLSWN